MRFTSLRTAARSVLKSSSFNTTSKLPRAAMSSATTDPGQTQADPAFAASEVLLATST